MMTTDLTFSADALHEFTLSWSSGVSSCDEFRFVEDRSGGYCDRVWNVSADWTAMKAPVFSLRISLEAYYVHCKLFFVESPFVKVVRRVIRDVKTSLKNGFRVVAGVVCPQGNAVQANLCLFTL